MRSSSMQESTKRHRLRSGLEAYFRRKSSPRFILGLILAVTALVGWLISFLLVHHGLDAMWLRYPIAVCGAYGVFLLLLRLWAEYERAQMGETDPALRQAMEIGDENTVVQKLPEEINAPPTKRRGSWLDWLDVPDFGLGDEGCLIVILLGAVVGLLFMLVAALSGAPALLTEVFIDACLAGALYRRLRIAAREHWLSTAVRNTWLYVLGAALLLGLAGGVLEMLAPGANSAGPALKQLVNGRALP